MWRGDSSSRQSEEGWEVSFSRKGKSQAPPTAAANRPKGGAYAPDKRGIKAWKGRGSHNVEGEKPDRLENPSGGQAQVYKKRGWNE